MGRRTAGIAWLVLAAALAQAACRTAPGAQTGGQGAAGAPSGPGPGAGPEASAAPEAEGMPEWLTDPRWRYEIDLSFRYRAASGFDDAHGDVGTRSAAVRFEANRSFWRGGLVSLEAAYDRAFYDFDGSNPLFPGTTAPFTQVHTVRAGIGLFQALSETWAVLVEADAYAATEVGAALEEGSSWTLLAGVGHQLHPALRLGAGVLLVDRFEEGLLLIPAVQFDWQIGEDWRLALEGPTLSLEHTFEGGHALSLAAGFDSRRYRLKDEAPARGAIVEDNRLPVLLRYAYRPEESVRLRLEAGLDAWRRLILEDRQGSNGRTFDLSPALVLGASLEVDL